jgi:hypothetical protein
MNCHESARSRGLDGAFAQLFFWSEKFPALVRRGRARVARLGRSVQRRTVPINKERFAASTRWLRVIEQTTPALRACPSLLRRGTSTNRVLCNSPVKPVSGAEYSTHL